jgi:PAS domain S-box-containing protein
MDRKILVVDDELDVRQTIESALRSENYHVQTADSGETAVAMLESEPFDLVITDIRMPGTDGVEVLQRTKEIDETIEVIILTGYASIENVIETLRNGGAYDYLTKPLEDIDAILFSAEQALNRRELRSTNHRLASELQRQNKELQRVQKALLQSEERFRTIASITSDYFYSMTISGIGDFEVDWIGGAFQKITGYEKEAVRSLDTWLRIVHPDDHGITDASIQRVLSNQRSTSQYRICLKNGGERWIRDYAQPVWDAAKNRVGSVIGAARDITSQGKMEKTLQQEQTFKAIASLAGGVAHEFNNALVGITGNLELMVMEMDADSDHSRYIQQIRSSTQRMTALTSQLLAYARGGKYRARTTTIEEFLKQALPLTMHAIGPSVRLETDVPSGIAPFDCDPTQLQMVLSAVLANASEAMQGRGRIRLKARNTTIDGRQKHLPDTLVRGAYVSLSVRDEGHGMDENTRARIFEPFFSTKMQGRGLGMAAVYGIVKNHGGSIAIRSQPSSGTTVTIFLPALETPLETVGEEPAGTPCKQDSATILMVDDEPVVLDVGRTILEKLGYRVLTGTCGRAAIDRLQADAAQIGLVLLDIKLPDMNGADVLEHIKSRYPEIKVIICSGYARDDMDRNFFALGADEFIQKPFTIAELSSKIGNLLSG